jgi:copper(I)-binding protein
MVDRADTYIQHFFLKQTYQPPEPRQTTRSHTSTGMGFFMPKILNSYKEDITMIKGLAITPPVLGRISIGKIVEKNGKRLLKKMTNLPLPAKSRIRMAG